MSTHQKIGPRPRPNDEGAVDVQITGTSTVLSGVYTSALRVSVEGAINPTYHWQFEVL